jgi:hypothetical protein
MRNLRYLPIPLVLVLATVGFLSLGIKYLVVGQWLLGALLIWLVIALHVFLVVISVLKMAARE